MRPDVVFCLVMLVIAAGTTFMVKLLRDHRNQSEPNHRFKFSGGSRRG